MVLVSEAPNVKGLISISPDAGIPSKNASPISSLLPLGYMLPRFLQNRIYWVERPPYGLRDPVLQEEITYSIQRSKKRESKHYGTFRTYLASFHETAKLRKTALARAGKLKTATLILQSREDTLMEPRNAELTYQRLGAQRNIPIPSSRNGNDVGGTGRNIRRAEAFFR